MASFLCAKCKNPLQFPDQMAGMTVNCPRCATPQVIPKASAAPPMVAAAPPPPRYESRGEMPPPPRQEYRDGPPRSRERTPPPPRRRDDGYDRRPPDDRRPRNDRRRDDDVETVAMGGSFVTSMPKPIFFALMGALGCLAAAMFMELPYRLIMPKVAEKPKDTAIYYFDIPVQLDKFEQADGTVKKLYITYKAKEVDGKPVDLSNSSRELSKEVKISLENEKGAKERDLTAKTLLTDDAAKEYFQPGKTIRAVVGPTEIKEIRVGPPSKGVPKADIMFVIDITGSMDWAINGVRDGINNFLNKFKDQNLEAQVGLTVYRDGFNRMGPDGISGDPWVFTFRNGTAYTNDPNEFREVLSRIRAGGGGDGPENCLEAMRMGAEKPGREGAVKVQVQITDDKPQPWPNYHANFDNTKRFLIDQKVRQVHFITRKHDFDNIYSRMWDEAKDDRGVSKLTGEYFDLNEVASRRRDFDSVLRVASEKIELGARAISGEGPRAVSATVATATSTGEFEAADSGRLILAVCLWTAIIAFGLALALIVGQRLYQGQSFFDVGALGKGSLSIIAGLLAGFIGGGLVILLTYSAEGTTNTALAVICQILGWTVLGSLIGLGMSLFVPNLSYGKGLLGGSLGGLAGALFFVLFTMAMGDLLGRWLGAILLGFFVGLMVALIEAAFRRSWLEVRFGPRETRTVTLGTSPVTVGGDERRATVVVPGAAPIAFRYFLDGDRIICEEKGRSVEMQPGEMRKIGNVTITACSPETAVKVGLFLKLSNGRDIPLSEGLPLTQDDLPGLGSNSPDGTVALVSSKPSDPSVLLLRNRSKNAWHVEDRDRQRRTVEPGLGVQIEHGTWIDFGRVQGELVRLKGKPRR